MKKINWIRLTKLYFFLSALVILPGLFSLIKWGLKPSIDFTGGTLLEIKGDKLDSTSVNQALEETNLAVNSQQKSGENTYLLKFSFLEDEKRDELLKAIEEKTGKVEILRWENLGPALGRELLVKTGTGMILAIITILIYISFQFKEKSFGICAILAMLHDSLILLGSFSLLGHFFGAEVDGLFVTAVLTILSFSVHDTVVVFDRIRELQKISSSKTSTEEIANAAISQTLTRSVNNSLTIIFMLLALVFLGGETTRWFATALLIGTVAGTYSSTFTAVPLLVVWRKVFKRK